MESRNQFQVCFSPALYKLYASEEQIVVVTDILRATTSICAAFENGAKAIIPVSSVEEARAMKKQGYMVASERDGNVLDFADFGNCPLNFTKTRVEGKEIVYSTTNGTRSINMAKEYSSVVIASFLNISAVSKWLIQQNRSVLILCASWKDRFSLEDSVFAGALSQQLLDSGNYSTICDSAQASLDLWRLARKDLIGYMQKAAQKSRLAAKGLDYCMEYCLTPDSSTVVPVYHDGKIINNQKMEMKSNGS